MGKIEWGSPQEYWALKLTSKKDADLVVLRNNAFEKGGCVERLVEHLMAMGNQEKVILGHGPCSVCKPLIAEILALLAPNTEGG